MRWLVLVMLIGCGRIGFDTDERSSTGGPGLTFGGQTWSDSGGATLVGTQLSVDARGTTWTATAPVIASDQMYELTGVATAIGTGPEQRFSIEFSLGGRGVECDVLRSGSGVSLRFETTTNGAPNSANGLAGAGGVFLGDTLALKIARAANSFDCAMMTRDGGADVGGGTGAADAVRITVVDAFVDLTFSHN